MAECEYVGDCPFYNGDNDEEVKNKYCRGNNLNCACYMIYSSCGKDKIPADLQPDQKTEAYLIIAQES